MKKVHDFVRDEKLDFGVMNRRMFMGVDGAIAINHSLDVIRMCENDYETIGALTALMLSVNKANEICGYHKILNKWIPVTNIDELYFVAGVIDNKRVQKKLNKLLSDVPDIIRRVPVFGTREPENHYILNREIAFLAAEKYEVPKETMDWWNSLEPLSDLDEED